MKRWIKKVRWDEELNEKKRVYDGGWIVDSGFELWELPREKVYIMY